MCLNIKIKNVTSTYLITGVGNTDNKQLNIFKPRAVVAAGAEALKIRKPRVEACLFYGGVFKQKHVGLDL